MNTISTERFQPTLDNPGSSEHLISVSEALRRKPDFLTSRNPEDNCTLTVRHPLTGQVEVFTGVDFQIRNRYVAVTSAVVTHPDGTPQYDRPKYDEVNPAIVAVAWGRDKDNTAKIALLSQARPHADDPYHASTEDIVFESVPMGFLDRIAGPEATSLLESAESGAVREIVEETGMSSVIKDIALPEIPATFTNPSFSGIYGNVVFVEVDLETIEQHKGEKNHGEMIYNAQYVALSKVWEGLQTGQTELGLTRNALSNANILMFMAWLQKAHPEIPITAKEERLMRQQVRDKEKLERRRKVIGNMSKGMNLREALFATRQTS